VITISLCMIVKNEEDVLGRCLNSVKDLVDEIIIVDTGSLDNTKEIAHEFTDKVFDFKWINDFSSARNYSFSKATMDYILWLDADDVLLPDDQIKFKRLKEKFDYSVDVFMMKYNYAFDGYNNVTLSHFRERLSRRIMPYIWKEPVHEYLEVWGKIINTDVCITHKKENAPIPGRNLAIYEKFISSGKTLSLRGIYYYARELHSNTRYDKAIEYFNKFLDNNDGWVEDKIGACYDLALCYQNVNNKKHMLKTLLRSFEYDTPRAEICCQLGYYYLALTDYNKAIFWYKLSTQLEKPKNSWGFILHDYWGYIPNIQLCFCYDRQGNINEAIKYNNIAAEYKPLSTVVNHNKNYFNKFINK
jgi:glycosyltransferase involved in cell wall biosynthesis